MYSANVPTAPPVCQGHGRDQDTLAVLMGLSSVGNDLSPVMTHSGQGWNVGPQGAGGKGRRLEEVVREGFLEETLELQPGGCTGSGKERCIWGSFPGKEHSL